MKTVLATRGAEGGSIEVSGQEQKEAGGAGTVAVD